MSPTAYEIVVTGGRQRGARAPLSAGGTLSVGSDIDADIVLFGAPDPTRLTLSHDGQERVTMTVLEGELSCDGESCESGSSRLLVAGVSVSAGKVTFTLDDAASAQATTTAPKTPTEQASRRGGRGEARVRAPARLLAFGLLILVGGALVGIGLSSVGARPETVTEQGHEDAIRAALVDAGYPDVELIMRPDGGLRIDGFIPSWEDHIALRALLAGYSASVEITARIGRTLEDAVADVYRVNGIVAEVVAKDDTHVEVTTQVADLQLLERAEAAVRADVPALESIERRNEAPMEIAAVPDVDYVEQPGKRVMAVVVGEPAYIVTEDQSRYFVGSSLPSGHTITAIARQSVTLDKGGVETQLDM